MKPKSIAIIGAGGRGAGFARLIAQSDPKAAVTAVAEPREDYRNAIAQTHHLPAERTFACWRDFVKQPRMCDAVVIATPDREHVGPAVACMKLGYDILLEKPMAISLEDCRTIEAAQRASGCIFGVCHSLRYAKAFRKVKELLDSGIIGRVITVNLTEQVAWWHQAHSFVRGNWGNSQRSTFMLMAKSCHDIDYLHYLVGRQCRRVSSFGALTYFRPENAPAGAGDRCTACPVERDCPYSAIKQYVEGDRTEWPAVVAAFEHSHAAHLEAIRSGPYGRCVWKCDNDVVDHQTLNLLFEDDITAVFTMTGFTRENARLLKVHGTLGELLFDEKSVIINTFADNNVQRIELGREIGTHGGGDQRIVDTWLDALHTRDDSQILANAQESLKTHTVVFAAERSRCEGRTIDLAEF